MLVIIKFHFPLFKYVKLKIKIDYNFIINEKDNK